jgi:predicted HicB family RNase H-like nuclease
MPVKRAAEAMSTVNFRLPVPLHEELREFAAAERMSMNQVVVRSIERFIRNADRRIA